MLSHRWVSYSLFDQFIGLLVMVSVYYIMSEPQNEVFEPETLLLKNLSPLPLSPPTKTLRAENF